MIRDLSLRSNKQVELVMDGMENGADCSLIEEIGDPIIHLLRIVSIMGSRQPRKECDEVSLKGKIVLKAEHEENLL